MVCLRPNWLETKYRPKKFVIRYRSWLSNGTETVLTTCVYFGMNQTEEADVDSCPDGKLKKRFEKTERLARSRQMTTEGLVLKYIERTAFVFHLKVRYRFSALT